jgi:hypothetical protein
MNQWRQIVNHMLGGRSITSMQAFRLYSITRCPDRIRDARAKGYRIESRMITLPSKKRVAQYWISP